MTVRKNYKHGEEVNLWFECTASVFMQWVIYKKKLKSNIHVPVQAETCAVGKQAFSSLRNYLFDVRM